MAEWLYSQFGQTKGPVSENTLINMVLKQELELEDYVMNPKDELWKKIKDVQHLLDKIHEPEKAIPHNVQFPKNLMDDDLVISPGNQYFYIPIKRLILMTAVSGGLYQLYWFYQQYTCWQQKSITKTGLSRRSGGMLAAIIGLFGNIELDKDLNAVARSNFPGTLLFWMWFLFGGTGSGFLYGMEGNLFLYFFLAIMGWTFGAIFLIPVQRYINQVNDKLGNTYERPGMGHYLCILTGIVIMIYTINAREVWKLFQGPKQKHPVETMEEQEGFRLLL